MHQKRMKYATWAAQQPRVAMDRSEQVASFVVMAAQEASQLARQMLRYDDKLLHLVIDIHSI
jgi:hypothetical protein